VPLALHVCVLVPQLPHTIGFVWPGAQTPAHLPVPGAHVWFVQAAAVPHLPSVPHVCTPLPEHCVAPALHATHPPSRQFPEGDVLGEPLDEPIELPDQAVVPDEGEPEDDPDDAFEELPDERPDESPDEFDGVLPPSVCNDGLPIPRIASHPALLAKARPALATITAYGRTPRITTPPSATARLYSSPRSVPPAPERSVRAPTS
jgi:hypothetical protein